ncbi:hypothetical protein [Actinacidiphila bryophytorum]|uniref:hypothetical protein n=1 Tax=Actinacidiphila bryophytorum TaxID=1436133 RepID=UPI002176B59D|nr:hypothetical protein [Actinacidiphila bryophytorum]UWE12239.1 hypothetical protein NYE86_28485 [Actinacidiphila bryophytorum]
MVNTVPVQREALHEAVPEVAAFARPAVRLHPRQAEPTAEQSSAGGPLLWPEHEAWPTCDGHQGRPRELAPLVQLFKHDLPADRALPDWMFPGSSDLLHILWCPEEHGEARLPTARLAWRNASALVDASARLPEPRDLDRAEAIPLPCVLHPEVVTELPPLNYAGDDPTESELVPPILPAELNERLSAWRHPSEPERPDGASHYWALATAPGWKLGGWADYASYPGRYARCPCGAQTRLVADLMSAEGLDSWWQPSAAPDFPWKGAPYDWSFHEPTQLRLGRDGFQALFGCTADPGHPLITYIE